MGKKATKKAPFVYASTDDELKNTIPQYDESDYMTFIEVHMEMPKNAQNIKMHRITKSYWRVNFWGMSPETDTSPSQKTIVDSKFIRIDIDTRGAMVYNDVSDGKLL